MLYLKSNTAMDIVVPRLTSSHAEANKLCLHSEINNADTNIAVQVVEVSTRYITISGRVPRLQDGEYRYELLNGNNIVSMGVAIVENEQNDVQYEQNNESEEYIQYE